MTYDDFKTKFNIVLNPQQEAAVKQTSGPTLLLAVPGSGKTTVIVARLGYMIYCQGIDPRSILTMTYTVSATNDMQTRFISKFGFQHANTLEFRTINSICARIIKHYVRTKQTTAFELIPETETLKIIREIYSSVTSEFPTENDIKGIKTLITYCKNMLLKDDEISQIESEYVDFSLIYGAYRKYMDQNRKMDFDDQLVYARRILNAHPDILAHFQKKYTYINVDEAQDTSKIQHIILQTLAARTRNLFMVGDEDQSIYGFRAAYPEALLSFEALYPEAKILLMEHNYRSTKAIVERANEFIKRNKSRRDKNMVTSRDTGDSVKHTTLPDCNRQYNYLAKMAESNNVETAILYRNNDSAIPIIDLLDKKGLPYQCRQLDGLFFSHYIVRDITDIIRFSFNPTSGALFQNIYYKLSYGLKKETMTAALKRHSKNDATPVLDILLEDEGFEQWTMTKLKALQTHLDNMRNDTCFAAVNRIVNFMGYGDYLKSRHADTTKVNILLALANQNPGLDNYLRRIDELNGVVSAGGSGLQSNFILSTIHSSKGLEYEKVILIDVVDGIFPRISEPKPREIIDEADLATLEEERRLFYVGVTRAKNQLEIISYENEYGKPGKVVSSFVTSFLASKLQPPRSAKNTPHQISSQKTHIFISSPLKTPPDIKVLAKDYIPNTKVAHRIFGDGVIIKKEDNIITIQFHSGSTKKLDLFSCIQKELIKLMNR